MKSKSLLDEAQEKILGVVRNAPSADLEKNLRALLTSLFDRLQLVAREDFEVQSALLERARLRLAALEARLAELEHRAPQAPSK